MLKKENRITKQKQFDDFFGPRFKKGSGRSAVGRFFVVKCFDSGNAAPRFGFVIGNKVDKRATARNRIKRRSREVIREKLPQIKLNWDCLIIAKASLKNADFESMRKEIIFLLKKVGLF